MHDLYLKKVLEASLPSETVDHIYREQDPEQPNQHPKADCVKEIPIVDDGAQDYQQVRDDGQVHHPLDRGFVREWKQPGILVQTGFEVKKQKSMNAL